MPQTSEGFMEQTKFCSPARNATCNLLNPRYCFPPRLFIIFFLYYKGFYKAEFYKGVFIRNFIEVIITEIKMSKYDPQST